jgi:hypothetical protein
MTGPIRTHPATLIGAIAIALLALAILIPGAAESRKAPGGFFGVASNTNRPASAEIDRMGTGRVSVLRININWAEIEPDPPTAGNPSFSFTELDRVVARAAANGIRVLPILYGTPKWLAKEPSVAPIRNSRQRTEWQRFVRAVAARYGNGGTFWEQNFLPVFPDSKVRAITHWQVWNEPTTRQFWKGATKRKAHIPRDYAKLLRATAEGIRGVDPDARLVTAGVFGTPHLGKGLRSRRFFRSLFAIRGIGKYFDSVGVHPYSPNWRGVRIQMGWAIREIRRAGLRKGIWITEIGWPTKGRKSDFQAYLQRSQKRQAATLRTIFKRLVNRRKLYRLGKVIWFTFRDNPRLGKEFARCNLCKYAGLFNKSLEPKQAWKAYTAFTGGSP